LIGTRGAFGARWETYVCARADEGAGPPALKLMESTRLCGQLSWASISFEDRDLIVPKSASSTNFRALGWIVWRALGRGGVRRYARTGELTRRSAGLFGARWGAEACGAARAPES
jgi:hypothetical protein